MSECSVYIPTPYPNKRLGSDKPFVPGIPGTSADRSMYLSWMIPTSFITVDPEISFCWVSLNEFPVNLDWVLKYQYLNKESYMGYFDESGMPVVSFDDGRSEPHVTTLKSENVAEKDMLQTTRPYHFVKKDRRSGTFVVMEIRPKDLFEEVSFIGAHIKYTESPRVIEPTGRKRTYKRKWYDYDPYC